MNEFIIVFRECLEASLIVGIIYTILAKSNLRDAIQKLWLGVAAATPNHNFCIASLKLDFARIVYMMPTIKEASKHSLKTIMNSFIYKYSNENDSH